MNDIINFEQLSPGFQCFPPFPTQAITEEGKKFKVSGFRRMEIDISVWVKNKGTDQLCSYCTADLLLCFSHIQKAVFVMLWLIYLYSLFFHRTYVHCYVPCRLQINLVLSRFQTIRDTGTTAEIFSPGNRATQKGRE